MSSVTLYKYKLYCNTDSKWEYVWLENTPTVCPINTAHSINTASISIVDELTQNAVVVKEESTPTGGNFGCTTIPINATANTTTAVEKSWPFPISALSIEFVTTSEHEGDTINLMAGKDTITGAITGNLAPASTWSAQNYTAGDIVIYNTRLYTCTTNTVSNEVPTNLTYWMPGYRIPVSSIVTQYAQVGFTIRLFDGSKQDDMGRIISIDKENNYLYMENNVINSFSAVTPTYIQQTTYIIYDYEIGKAWEYRIGESKIGGSYLPANTLIRAEYTNKHPTQDKTLIGRVEHLY